MAKPPPPPIINGRWHTLGFSVQKQQHDNWCWAAVAHSMSVYYGDNLPRSQCQVATRVLSDAGGCCGSPFNTQCDVYAFLSTALVAVSHLSHWHSTGPAAEPDVRAEIDAGRPLSIRMAYYAGGGAHFVTIMGYGTGPGPDTLLVDDSLKDHFGRFLTTHDELVHGFIHADWTDSCFTK